MTRLVNLQVKVRAALRMIRPRLPSTEAWAAIAAIAAAIAAFMSYTQQQQAASDAMRPELILADWRVDFDEPEKFSDVYVGTIENIGRGPAFNAVVYLQRQSDEPPFEVLGNFTRISVLAEDERVELETHLLLRIPPATEAGRIRGATFEVHVGYSDSGGRRYRTIYMMQVADQEIAGAEYIDDQVILMDRRTIVD